MLMAENLYRGEATKEMYAREWKISRATVDEIVREASRSIQLDVSEDPGELLARIYAGAQSIVSDSVDRVRSEVDNEGKPAVGKKGHMSHGAVVGYYQTALSGLRDLAALVQKTPQAFVPLDKRVAEGEVNGRPVVNINVVLAPKPAEGPATTDAATGAPIADAPPVPKS
jgi:hypothetical protein